MKDSEIYALTLRAIDALPPELVAIRREFLEGSRAKEESYLALFDGGMRGYEENPAGPRGTRVKGPIGKRGIKDSGRNYTPSYPPAYEDYLAKQ